MMAEHITTPPGQSLQDATDQHRRIREDLELVDKIMGGFIWRVDVYLPQAGLHSERRILQRISTLAKGISRNLSMARANLRKANSLALRLKPIDQDTKERISVPLIAIAR